MPEEKMVKESDLIALKKKTEKLELKNSELEKQVAEAEGARRQAESQMKVLKANLEDGTAEKEIRDFLLAEEERVNKLRGETEGNVATLKEREKVARAKELAMDLKSKGVEIDHQSLLDADSMELKAKDVYIEFLAKQREEAKKEETPAETVFDRGKGAVSKKDVWAMDTKTEEGRKQFAAYEKELKQKAGVA